MFMSNAGHASISPVYPEKLVFGSGLVLTSLGWYQNCIEAVGSLKPHAGVPLSAAGTSVDCGGLAGMIWFG